MDNKALIDKAIEAMGRAYAPYSSFKVGAALLCADGQIYTGCNIENSSFSPTICAERVAVSKAVSEGKRDFCAIAVVGGKDGEISDYCFPCGVCRQVISEFCSDDFAVILYNGKEMKEYTLDEILPFRFSLRKQKTTLSSGFFIY